MRKRLLPLLLLGLATACSHKDDPAPTYADYTPISGQFRVDIDGFFRPTKQDTTAVLRNLQLRISTSTYNSQAVDIYEMKGDVSAREALYLRYVLPQNRLGTGPWAALELTTEHLLNGKAYDYGFGSGSLARTGDKFTADFDVAAIQGTLQ